MSSGLDFLAEVQKLAQLHPLEYDQNRKPAAERLGVRVKTLDKEVSKARRNASNTRTRCNQAVGGEGLGDCSSEGLYTPPVRTREELFEAARPIIEATDPLRQVDETVAQLGYAGDRLPVLLVYVVITSRLLGKPINAHIIAPSASGKNFTLDTALQLIPDDAIYRLTASTPKAMIYSDQSFKHKTVVLTECDSILHLQGNAATLVRSIIEDARTDYDTVEKDPETGRNVVRRVSKEGPTGLITTGVRDLEFQTSTRVLTVSISDSPEQTRAVMRAEAVRAAGQAAVIDADMIERFRDYQRWLAGGPSDLIVPFAQQLAEMIPASETRMRRDFKQLLSVIETVALMNQQRREKDAEGCLVASLDDYAWARTLLLQTFKTAVGGGITPAIRQTVLAVEDGQETSQSDLMRRLRLSKGAVAWRTNRAIRGGWLSNLESRQGYPARLVRAAPLPEDSSPLPTREDLKQAFERSSNSNNHSNGPKPQGAERESESAFEPSDENMGFELSEDADESRGRNLQ